jgi:c-di-AMP phosphodiesterase-like protein
MAVFSIPEVPKMNHKSEWMTVIKFFSLWIIIWILLLITMPASLWWITWIPIAVIITVLVLSAITIGLSYTDHWKNYLIPNHAEINGRSVSACEFCQHGIKRVNPLSENNPIFKCEEKNMRLILYPKKVPGWCPYVRK